MRFASAPFRNFVPGKLVLALQVERRESRGWPSFCGSILKPLQDFFAESRRLESESECEKMVPWRRGSEELKEKFWLKSKEDFVEAWWDHLCTAEGWE